MIAAPPGVHVWLAGGVTDMRCGMNALALKVQEGLGRDPHAGDVFVFRGRRGDLLKCLWCDGLGMSLYVKRLERGRFIWPSPASGAVAISAAQLAYLLDAIDWRNPQQTWRPQTVG
jgi:transposase